MKKEKVYPITSATVNLTQECNMACAYCFTGGKTSKKISMEMAKRCSDFLIRNAATADLDTLNGKKRQINLSFWGGEPLLEWDLLKDIVTYTNSVLPSGVSAVYGGTTNGMLLTTEKFDFLDSNRLFFLVSLDGTQETHDRYRVTKSGEGTHSIVMKNMEAVLKRWPFYKARVSLYPERVSHFYEDIKYLFEHGVYGLMFSPVYEHTWTKENWNTWKEEGFKVVNLMAEYKAKGIKTSIEHLQSYICGDSSEWPCGAGRFYVGIDVDGSIWPCHRFSKFRDSRPWQEKEMCIGHIDHGITRPEVRNLFIDFTPLSCDGCKHLRNTPCHGGCYAANFDLEGDIRKAHPQMCDYVDVQKEVSLFFKEKGLEEVKNGNPNERACICHNMCYLEGTPEEVIDIRPDDLHCHCNRASYMGDTDTSKVARPIKKKQINPLEILKRVEALEEKMTSINDKLDAILGKLN